MKSYYLRNEYFILMWSSYYRNAEQFVTWIIGHRSQRHIFQNSSVCSLYHVWYTTIWGIWSWMKSRIFLRLEEIKEIPHFVGFLVHLNPTTWGIWIWNENRIFLRLKVIRENSSFCRILVQWNPTIWGINISFWRKMVIIENQLFLRS